MTTPRLAIISIVRNEADIIETFVRHHAGVASKMIFVLHRCIDNTREILERLEAEGLPVEIHEHTDPGYPAPEILEGNIARVVTQNTTEWILPLDADEFLTVKEGSTHTDALAALPSNRVFTLARKTYVPTPEDDAAEGNPLRRIVQRKAAEQPPSSCMLIPATLLKNIPWKISPNRQHLVRELGDLLPIPSSVALGIAHVPVRTPEQCMAKVLGGWASLAMHPAADPRRAAQWRGLAERCSSGRPLTLGELRNIALRYGMPEGMIGIPGLVYDPIPTQTHRPQLPMRAVHPIAVLMDYALASAQQGAGNTGYALRNRDPLTTFSLSLTEAINRLRCALEEVKEDTHFSADIRPETGAPACALLLLSAVAGDSEPVTGSALIRRQTLGTRISAVPAQWQWIAAMLQANKLPLSLESALQELVQLLQAQDLASLRQQCRKESASDDLTLHVSQMLTKDLRLPVPLVLGTFLAQAVHTLLIQEAGVSGGVADPRVRAVHLAAGRGELAGEMLRRMVNAGIERGANPDALRRDILSRTVFQESSPVLQSVLTIRISVLLQTLRMPLQEGEALSIRAEFAGTDHATDIPLLCAVLGETDENPLSPDAEHLLGQYLCSAIRGRMEQDAKMSPELRGIARVHAFLKTKEIGLGAIIAPRAVLHGTIGSHMREALLEDCEQIRVLDLHGNPAESADDEPMDGADRSGTCILLLLRAPKAAQKTLFMEWRGLKLQKYHVLLSRGVPELPWKVIAPEKPGYVFLG